MYYISMIKPYFILTTRVTLNFKILLNLSKAFLKYYFKVCSHVQDCSSMFHLV